MAKGRVYIVKNPLFPTLFKIGFTTTLQFVRDSSIHVKVIDNKKVEYDSKPQSFSLVTALLLKAKWKYVNPSPHWTYEGKNLRDIYNETYPVNTKA